MRSEDSGLLLLRLGVGLTLAAHGTQELFGWFGGHGLTATGVGFETWVSDRVGRAPWPQGSRRLEAVC